MSSRSVIRRIRLIEDRIVPKPVDDLVIVWSFGSVDEPHGKFGYRKFHVYTGTVEACNIDEELGFLREAYQRVSPDLRKRVSSWGCFEDFLDYHRCSCSVHNSAFQGAEVQKMLREYDEVLEQAVLRSLEAKEKELLAKTRGENSSNKQ